MLAKNMNITLLALLAIVLPVIAISNGKIGNTIISKKAYTIIHSTCASTLYPDLCISSFTSSFPRNITTRMDVIMGSLNHTIATIQFNKFTINKIAKNNSLTVREKTALIDCNKTAEDSLFELKKVEIKLQHYTSKNSSIADDLGTLLSAAITNQETCIDGFSHDEASRVIRSGFLAKQLHAYKLCSNILAMVKNMTDSWKGDEIVGEIAPNNAGHEWPKWLYAGDNRKLLK